MNEITGYKNAPDVKPQIGDIVQCGLPGETAVVVSIDTFVENVINCAFNGKLILNRPSTAILVESVDGVSYR